MAKKSSVKKLSDFESKFVQNEGGSYFLNLKTTGNATYVSDKSAWGNHYVVIDYSSLNPSEMSKAYAIKKGDDLIFVAEIFKGSKLSKTITTTIQDYYKWSNGVYVENLLAAERSWNSYIRPYWNDRQAWYEYDTQLGKFVWYSGGYTTYHPYTYAQGYITDMEYSGNIAGSNGVDNYVIKDNSVINNIFDEAGNDTYTFDKGSLNGTIYDYKGNDIYGAYRSSFDVEDYAGNDQYKVYYDGNLGVKDYAGNDTYDAYKTDGESYIEDYAGNDVYNAINVDSEFIIDDKEGNDKYFANNVGYFEVTDYAGNDSYTAIGLNSPYIHDYKGNDNYNLNQIQGTSDDYSQITDEAGKDNYIITNSQYGKIEDQNGNDKYNLTYVDEYILDDYKGSDTYVIRNSYVEDLTDYETSKKTSKDTYTVTDNACVGRIVDKAGNDSYTISNYSRMDDYLDDFGGKDKYTVTNNSFANIEDEGKENDTFNVFANSKGYIYDEGGNDTYNVDLSSNVEIDDRGGKDTLKIAGSDKSNLIFMANFKLSTTDTLHDVQDGSLFIFDKSNNGYIEIENFFALEHHGDPKNYIDKDKKGSGFIENVFAGKTNVNSLIASYTDKCEVGTEGFLGSAVAQWLSDNSYSTSTYSSIEAIMNSNIADEFIATFVAAQ